MPVLPLCAGVRPQAWSLRARSSFRVSAARARAGSMLRVNSARCPSIRRKGLKRRLRQWEYSIMKLVADDNGRLACKSLFTPKKAFSAERQADGRSEERRVG